jgi:hypothetical protein
MNAGPSRMIMEHGHARWEQGGELLIDQRRTYPQIAAKPVKPGSFS